MKNQHDFLKKFCQNFWNFWNFFKIFFSVLGHIHIRSKGEFLYKHVCQSVLSKFLSVSEIFWPGFVFWLFQVIYYGIVNFTPRRWHFCTPSPQFNVDQHNELFAERWNFTSTHVGSIRLKWGILEKSRQCRV